MQLPKGVYVSGKKFTAKLRHNSILLYLGSFSTIQEAEKAVLDKQEELGVTGNKRMMERKQNE